MEEESGKGERERESESERARESERAFSRAPLPSKVSAGFLEKVNPRVNLTGSTWLAGLPCRVKGMCRVHGL